MVHVANAFPTISKFAQDGTYKPDGPTVSNSFGKDSYGLWQILVSSDAPVNQNTVIVASISVDFERNVLIADIPALIIDWTSDSSANAVYGRVTSTNSSVEVVVRQQSSSQLSQVLETSSPKIMKFVQGFAPCTGSLQAFSVEGVSLGFTAAVGGMLQTGDPSPRFKIGYSSCLSSTWLSDTSVICKAGGRNVISNSMILSVDFQTLNISNTDGEYGTFESVQVQASQNEAYRPSSGSMHVKIVIANAGVNDYTSKLRVGKCAPEAQRWCADSSISGKSVAFLSKRFLVYSIFLSVPVRIVALGTFSIPQREYHLNVTNSIDIASSIFATSSVVLTIFGLEFGGQLSSGKIRIRRSSCESSEWQSVSSISCKTPSLATSSSVSFITTLDSVLSAVESGSSIRLQHITKVICGTLPSTGSAAVKVFATFGSFDFTSTLKSSGTRSEAQIWQADSCMALKIPASSKMSLNFLYTSNQMVWKSLSTVSFANMELYALNGSIISTGSTLAQAYGFAFAYQGNSQKVRIKRSANEASIWRSDSVVKLKTSVGFWNSGALSLSSNARMVQNATFLTLDSIINPRSQMMISSESSGSRLVALSGILMGKMCSSLSSKFGFTSCESSKWISDSSTVSKRIATMGPFVAFVLIQLSLSDNRRMVVYGNVSENTGHVTNMDVQNLNPLAFSSSQILMISGFSQLASMISSKIRTGATSCQNSMWMSSSSIWCKIHFAAAINMKISLSNGNTEYVWQSRSMRSNATASLVRPINGPATGSSSIQILGRDFNLYDSCNRHRTGYTASESSVWTSSSKIASKTAKARNSETLSLILSLTTNYVLTQENALQTDTDNPAFNISGIQAPFSQSSGSIQVYVTGQTALTTDKTACARIR